MKSTTKKKRQAKEQEKRGQKRLEKRKRKSCEPGHGPRPTRNQKEVAKRLLAGEVSMVGGTGWSFVEPFLAFLGEIGFYEVIRIDGERFVRKNVPRRLAPREEVLARMAELGLSE